MMSLLSILHVRDLKKKKKRADFTVKNTATSTSEREPPLQIHWRRSYQYRDCWCGVLREFSRKHDLTGLPLPSLIFSYQIIQFPVRATAPGFSKVSQFLEMTRSMRVKIPHLRENLQTTQQRVMEESDTHVLQHQMRHLRGFSMKLDWPDV